MRNVRTAVLGVSVAALALTMPSPAAAKVTETWQVAINMPESLSIDAGGIFSITPDKQKLKVNGRKRTGRWQNFTISYPTLSQALKQTREKDQPQDVALSDRALTRKQSKKLSQRLLWIDADVLLVSADNPVCQTGVTSAQIQQMLSGGTRDWQQIAAPGTWPAGAPSDIRVYVPWRDGGSQLLFGMRAYGPATVAREADAVSAVPRLISAAVVAKYSALRANPGACAVPVDGISPNDATVASGAYPHTQRVYWVTKKKQPKYERTVRRAYEKYLFGTVGDQFLGTVGQRDRLRP